MTNQNRPSQLTTHQVIHFYRLWFGLLQYTNERHKFVAAMLGKDFHRGVDVDDVGKIARYIWSHPQTFDEYLQAKALDEYDSETLRLWQQYHYKNKFYIIRYLRDGAVFLSTGKDEKPYVVKGLVSAFDEMWPKQSLPSLVETVLLPFEGVITTCGLFYGSQILFGGNMSRDIREACQQAELTYGLITSLPHRQVVSTQEKDIAQIKFYLQSPKILELYQYDLEELIHKHPEKYLPVYFYHRGLLETKKVKREYRKLGLKKFHFAVYGSVIIAVHPDKHQVENTVEKLVPPKELDRIVYDKI